MKSTIRSWPLGVLILLLLCFSLPSNGQEELHYTGPFQVGNYTGEVDYTYQINNGDTLLQGPFNFRRSNLGALLDQKDKTFSITGDFQEGFPNGSWQFKFGEFESDKKTEVVGYQYRVNINGIQQEAKGMIAKGKPDGTWIISEEEIADSKIKETLFKSTINYANGVPQQSFQIERGKSTLVGRFLRNGLAHDEWTLFGEDLTEIWTFNNGLLTNLQWETGEGRRSVSVYGKSLGMSKIINLDARFTQLLKLQLSANDTDSLAEGISLILDKNASRYKKLDAILSQLGPSEFMPMFKVKVPYAPLDSLEKKQFVTIKKEYDRSSGLAKGLLENTQLNLLKRSDKEAQFLYEVVQYLDTIFVAPLQKVVSYQEQNILDYISREQLMAHLYTIGVPSKQVSITSEREESLRLFELVNAKDYEFEGPVFASLSQIAKYTRASLEQIADLLYKKVENEQQQQELVMLEKQMIVQINQLHQVIDSTEAVDNTLKGLERIKIQAEERLNSYSTLPNSTGKLEKAKFLTGCLNAFENLAHHLDSLPQKEREIHEKYKDAVWNPFMANLMDEEVKKRITLVYHDILIPDILKQVNTDLDCEKAVVLHRLLVDLHDRMLQLRDEDTAKLERKLRKEKNPKTILALFNLQSLEK
ncbi:MAG: hypothetical protein ABJN84_09300 [Flavobacteriaceae bacterium]